jgi:hypothetical protein
MRTIRQNDRRRQVLRLAAEKAYRFPLMDSGFWFQNDMRDNLYYGLHLYAACADEGLELSVPRSEGRQLAERMLHAVLDLQVTDSADPMFGHWPLNLNPDPKAAPANTLPVELLGSMLAWFHTKYAPVMESGLEEHFRQTLLRIYQGGYYRKPVEAFNHHESKYVSQQLIWGELFDDQELSETGIRNLRKLLQTIRANGMREYGALPWFWHWVQSFSFAKELVKSREASGLLDEMLAFLWSMRASVYLKGTWAGPHSRVLPHDVPADRNNLIDYVVFGDFPLPDDILRLEAAGLLEPSVDESVIQKAVERLYASTVKRLIPLDPEHVEAGSLHAYVHITPDYAIGGVWERAEEYLNEQHRWDVTLPVTASDGRANQAFFFTPGSGYAGGDPRHQSGGSEILLHENTAGALYRLAGDGSGDGLLLGCLPLGEWQFEDRLMAGRVGDVYLIARTMQPSEAIQGQDRIELRSAGLRNGAVIEALNATTAEARGWRSLSAVVEAARAGAAVFTDEGEGGGLRMEYATLSTGGRLLLALGADGSIQARTVNGESVDFGDYSVLPD